jgi:hypothetical protein
MKGIIEKIQNWDPLNMKDESNLTTIRPKFMLIAVGAVTTFAFTILLFILLSLVSNRNSLLGAYKSQLKQWSKLQEAERFADLRIGMKIMPSENTRLNVINMLWSNSSNLIKNQKIQKLYSHNESFHFFDETAQYFPVLKFEDGEVPFGDSDFYCFYLSWTYKEHEGMNDLYETVKSLPKCLNAYDNKFVWRRNDPKDGIDIKTFIQDGSIIKCKSQSDCYSQCKSLNGVGKKLVNSSYACYTYKVLNDVCFTVRHTKAGWNYEGGCFKDKEPGHYVEAVPGQKYNFENLLVQVRDAMDPFVNITNKGDAPNFGVDIDWIYSLLWFIFWCSFIVMIGCALFYVFRKGIVQFLNRSKSQSDPNSNANP